MQVVHLFEVCYKYKFLNCMQEVKTTCPFQLLSYNKVQLGYSYMQGHFEVCSIQYIFYTCSFLLMDQQGKKLTWIKQA